jgi:arsenate reductase
MSERPLRVLFVCSGNSARSQMAEALLRHLGGPAFAAFSAGTEPKGVNPLTLRALDLAGVDATGLRSKSVTEFLDQAFDYVVTVCDRARETCPLFPGEHESLHWGFDDPAGAAGTEEERRAVFERVMSEIAGRIRVFIPVALAARQRRTPTVGS